MFGRTFPVHRPSARLMINHSGEINWCTTAPSKANRLLVVSTCLANIRQKIVNLPQFLSGVEIIDKKLLETTTHPWNILKICTWNIMKLDECQWSAARQNIANYGIGEKSLHGSSKRPLLRMSCPSKGDIQYIENMRTSIFTHIIHVWYISLYMCFLQWQNMANVFKYTIHGW